MTGPPRKIWRPLLAELTSSLGLIMVGLSQGCRHHSAGDSRPHPNVWALSRRTERCHRPHRRIRPHVE